MKTCQLDDCDIKHYTKGFCRQHGRSMEKYGDPYRGIKKESPTTCLLKGCDRKHQSKGFCDMHYRRFRADKPLNDPVRNSGDDFEVEYETPEGYVRVRLPQRKQKYKHRMVMEEHLGRALLPHETVHHINGVRNDNRLENLELWSSSQPAGQRVEDKVAWAKDILALYEKGQE